jgi:peroxiredoxin
MQMETRQPQDQMIGSPVEDFTLSSISGGQHNLSAALYGKKGAVVIFWSAVCSHCMRYDGYLNNFSRSYPELALIVVASRHGESLEQLRKTKSERGIRFLIVHDPERAVAMRWATRQTPRAFLIGAARTLVYRGAIDNFKYPADPGYIAYLEYAIAEFLAGRPVRRAETPSFGCATQSVYYTLPKHL